MFLSLLSKAKNEYKDLKANIENWYDSNMDRATGWYKRKQQKNLFWFGIAVALILNVDSIHLFKVISMDDALRTNLNLVAEGIAEGNSIDSLQKADFAKQISIIKTNLHKIDTTRIDSLHYKMVVATGDKLESVVTRFNYSDSIRMQNLKQANEIIDIAAQLGLPIGWSKNTAPASWDRFPIRRLNEKHSNIQYPKSETKLGDYLYKRNQDPNLGTFLLWIAGVFISGLMLSFGAPFWFDLMAKLVNVRKAGIKPAVKSKNV